MTLSVLKNQQLSMCWPSFTHCIETPETQVECISFHPAFSEGTTLENLVFIIPMHLFMLCCTICTFPKHLQIDALDSPAL